jgi:hypothetical protein
MKSRAMRSRSRRMLSAVVWLGLTVFLGHFALMAWSHSIPYLEDLSFAHRFGQLHSRVRSASPSKPTVVIMLGSSRTLNLFNARVIEAALQEDRQSPYLIHNLGFTGAGPVVQYLTLKRLLSAGIRPDLVLVEFCPIFHHSLGSELQDIAWFDPNRLLDGEAQDLAPFGLVRPSRSLWDRVVPTWYGGREFLTRPTCNGLPPNTAHFPRTDAWGHWPLNRQTAETRARNFKKTRDDYAPILQNWSPGRGIAVLQLLLNRCHNDGIPVLLVMTPEAPSMRSWYSADAKKRVQEFVDHRGAGPDWPFIDAWTWLEEDDFEDSHHANVDGARKFSNRLTQEFLIPRFRDGSNERDKRAPERPFLTTSNPSSP